MHEEQSPSLGAQGSQRLCPGELNVNFLIDLFISYSETSKTSGALCKILNR